MELNNAHRSDTDTSLPGSHAALRKPEIEVLLDPQLSEREQAQLARWNALAPTQVERTRENMRQPGVNERQSSLIQRYPELGTGRSLILDFGAGIGCATEIFRAAGAQVVALELSPEMIQLTRDYPVVPYHRVILYSAIGDRELSELSRNPINPGTVDGIICYGAFQNFPARGQAPGEFDETVALKVLRRMHQLLKPGGPVSIEYLPPHPSVNFHESTTIMDPERFRRVFEQAGFSVIDNKRVFAYVHDQLHVEVYYQLIEGTKG